MIPITNIIGRLGNQMFQTAYLFAQMKLGEIPDIYVQGEKYFAEAKDEVRKLYSEHVFNIGQGVQPCVAIHVRRGDYVNNPFYVDLFATGYYERAMAEFPDEQFVVFSDDIAWCKEQDVFKGCEFSEGKEEVEDLNAMARCKSVIMANSSFSWWGAWLGNHEKVIAPRAWFSDEVERVDLLDSWIKI